jgi:hypothetical protein
MQASSCRQRGNFCAEILVGAQSPQGRTLIEFYKQWPGDVLLATHKELEERTKSGMARATARAAAEAERLEQVLPRSQQLQQLASAAARVFGWNQGGVEVNVGASSQVAIVCSEEERQALIEQRNRILGAEQAKLGDKKGGRPDS